MDLEGAVDKMRGQQSELQRRLKEEMDRKTKLEVKKTGSSAASLKVICLVLNVIYLVSGHVAERL